MSRAEIEPAQLTRLKDAVKRVYEKMPTHRAKTEAASIQPGDVQTLRDLQKLPFTIKQDMRDNYPYGLLAVPREELLRVHASSGTTGKPTVVEHTQNDLDVWRECVARITVADGATDEDATQICSEYGMFTGVLDLHNGLERVGVAIVPSSAGNTQKQLMHMKGLETTLSVATPSYAMRVAEMALEMGPDPKKDLKAESLVLGSEPIMRAMRNELHKVWGEDVNLIQNYSMSEFMGPGVSEECLELNGMYINEDHFIAEVIGPKTGQVLPAGEKGELVITCITKEALPLICYRTEDITRLMYEPCPCGRTAARVESLSGRMNGVLKICGVNVSPSRIEEVLINTGGIRLNYEILMDRKNYSDLPTTKVEVEAESMMNSCAALERLDQGLEEKMCTILGLGAKIWLVPLNTLQRFEGKARRATDLRAGKNEVQYSRTPR